jgi:hypothetical protein
MVEEERSVLGWVKFVSRGEMVSELVDQAFEWVCTLTTASQHSTTQRATHSARCRGSHNHTPSLTASRHHHSVRHSSAQHRITPQHTAPHHDDHQITTIDNAKCFFGGVGQILNPSTIPLEDAFDGIIG